MTEPTEPWIPLFVPGVLQITREQLGRVIGALGVENELQILDKYAGWTEEEAWKRWFELPTGEKTLEHDFRTLALALQSAKERASPPPPRLLGTWREARARTMPDTEEYKEIRQISDYFEKTCGQNEYGGFLNDGKLRSEVDIEFLNRIIERLNQSAKTNELLRTYWDYRKRPQPIIVD